MTKNKKEQVKSSTGSEIMNDLVFLDDVTKLQDTVSDTKYIEIPYKIP